MVSQISRISEPLGNILQHQSPVTSQKSHAEKHLCAVQETGFAQAMSWYNRCTSFLTSLWQNSIPGLRSV